MNTGLNFTSATGCGNRRHYAENDNAFTLAQREHERRIAQGRTYQLTNSDCHRLRNCLRTRCAVHVPLQQGQLVRVVTGDPDRQGHRPVAIFDHTRHDKPCLYKAEALPDGHYLPACQALEQWFGEKEQVA